MTLRLRTILSIAAAAFSAVSCLSSVKTDGSDTVEFLPMLANDVRSGNVASKTTQAFDEFGVYAFKDDGSLFMNRERVSFDGSIWSSDQKFDWNSGNKLRFLAYTPYMDGVRDVIKEGFLRIDDYDVTSAHAPVCYSDLTSPLEKQAGPVVVLFNPATARIEFRVINGLGTDTKIKIEKIIIQNIHISGSFDSSKTPQWTLGNESADFVAYEATEEELKRDVLIPQELYRVGEMINMIPQTPSAPVKVVFSMQTAESTWLTGQEAYTQNLQAAWEAGRRYTYTLTITGAHEVNYSMGVGNWEERQ